MKRVYWTDEEIQILKEKYVEFGATKVSKLVRHPLNSVRDKAGFLGLTVPQKPRDLTGQRFSRLVVTKLDHRKKYGRSYVYFWLCQCDCGNTKIVSGQVLLNGETKSCGCYRKEVCGNQFRKHGKRMTGLYGTWSNMKNRCYDKNNNRYKRYGGRGIKLCEEWLNDFMIFYKWAVNNGYKEGLSIDRINNNGNYEPSNCRWVDSKIQARNTSRNRIITYKGQTKCLTEWAEITGIKELIIYKRLARGWSIEKALTTPAMK